MDQDTYKPETSKKKKKRRKSNRHNQKKNKILPLDTEILEKKTAPTQSLKCIRTVKQLGSSKTNSGKNETEHNKVEAMLSSLKKQRAETQKKERLKVQQLKRDRNQLEVNTTSIDIKKITPKASQQTLLASDKTKYKHVSRITNTMDACNRNTKAAISKQSTPEVSFEAKKIKNYVIPKNIAKTATVTHEQPEKKVLVHAKQSTPSSQTVPFSMKAIDKTNTITKHQNDTKEFTKREDSKKNNTCFDCFKWKMSDLPSNSKKSSSLLIQTSKSSSVVPNSLNKPAENTAKGVQYEQLQPMYTETGNSVVRSEPCKRRSEEDMDFVVESDIKADVSIDTEEDMDVDVEMSRQQIAITMQELQQLKGSLADYVNNAANTASVQAVSSYHPIQQGPHRLYIIVDTNVLLSHLKFIDQLKNEEISVCLVIPWVVMQELDALKTFRASMKRHARQAISMIYKAIKEKHPRILGQTPQEAVQQACYFPVESNDDRILQCCLYYKQLYSNSSIDVILLSNDYNLCSKTMISGVMAYTRQTVMDALTAMRNKAVPDSMVWNFPRQPNVRAEVSCEQAKDQSDTVCRDLIIDDKEIDAIYCDATSMLRETLSELISTEMECVYGNIWTDIVFRKPPWNCLETLECMNKHWIAVFGMLLPKPLNSVIQATLNIYKYKKQFSMSTLDQLTMHLIDIKCIFEALNSYKSCKKRCSSIQTLKKHIEHIKQLSSPKRRISQQDVDVLSNHGDTSDRQVVDKFQTVWETIDNYCTMCKNLFQVGKDTNLSPDVKSKVKNFIWNLLQNSRMLKDAYESMLSVPSHQMSADNKFLIQFVDTFNLMSRKSSMQINDKSVTCQQVYLFYQRESNRDILLNGLHQLQTMISRLTNGLMFLSDSVS